MNAIEIKNLHFSYGKENVLDGVSLCLKEGRLAILAGENGAGKSTVFKAIENLIFLDGGSIEVFGKPHTELNAKDR